MVVEDRLNKIVKRLDGRCLDSALMGTYVMWYRPLHHLLTVILCSVSLVVSMTGKVEEAHHNVP